MVFRVKKGVGPVEVHTPHESVVYEEGHVIEPRHVDIISPELLKETKK